MAFLILSVAGRLFERTIDSLGGVLCLFLGFKLFSAYAADVTNAQISGSGFTFKAERVGPGIFFALFGAAILVYSSTNPVKISQETIGAANQLEQSTVLSQSSSDTKQEQNFAGAVDIGGGAASVAQVRLQALVTYEQVAGMDAGDQAPRLDKAKIGLEAIKAALIEDIYGKDRFIEWEQLVAMRGIQDAQLSKELGADPNLRRRFEEIEDAATKGF